MKTIVTFIDFDGRLINTLLNLNSGRIVKTLDSDFLGNKKIFAITNDRKLRIDYNSYTYSSNTGKSYVRFINFKPFFETKRFIMFAGEIIDKIVIPYHKNYDESRVYNKAMFMFLSKHPNITSLSIIHAHNKWAGDIFYFINPIYDQHEVAQLMSETEMIALWEGV
jgi:hypothetical protein